MSENPIPKKPETIENKFYEFLKDAQPIAFLASFSIIIAVFAYPNHKFNSIFEFAASAAAMFLISFIVSLTGRLALQKEKIDESVSSYYTDLARYGAFFFFGMGIFYLVLILTEFSKIVPSISSIVSGWIPLFLALVP